MTYYLVSIKPNGSITVEVTTRSEEFAYEWMRRNAKPNYQYKILVEFCKDDI